MQISADISMYPLTDDYLPYIKNFIDRLENTQGLSVVGNTISTQIFGEFDLVMDTIKEEIHLSWQEFGRSIFVVKYLGRNLDPALNPHG